MMTTRRVLVVDDDQVVGRSINRVLAEKGYQVREALDGHEALDEMAHQDYDLVFTDIKMPGMDGLEVASKVKKLHPGVPVVMITGYGTEANEQKARSIGVTAFLRKPLTPEMIVENADLALQERKETLEAIRLSALALVQPAETAAPAVVEERENVARNVALFFAAPFIGLAYILAFPFIGVWAMGKYGIKALTGNR
jgi:DNA-binding NtrC family response regulator